MFRPQPMTTLLMHVATSEDHRTSYVPEGWKGVVQQLIGPGSARRTLEAFAAGDAPALGGPSLVRTWFEPSRKRGVIQVRRPGADLVRAVLDKVRWMADGHMEHVSVLIPIDTPAVAGMLPTMEEAGLFFGGYVPDLDDRDCILMQWLDCDTLDIGAIDVIGDEAVALREAVRGDWQRARAAGLSRPGTGALAG